MAFLSDLAFGIVPCSLFIFLVVAVVLANVYTWKYSRSAGIGTTTLAVIIVVGIMIQAGIVGTRK